MIDPFDLPADITFYFECGCRYVVAKSENSLDGLACCAKHEAPHQNIRNLLPLKLVKVMYHPKTEKK